MKSKPVAAMIIISIGIIILCAHFVDQPLATALWGMTSTTPFLDKHIRYIPNTLPLLATICTLFFFILYFISTRFDYSAAQRQFFKLAACSVPLAYGTKLFLQHMFGRTNIRVWLNTGGDIGFNWFHPVANGGFPSGHSMVFAAFFCAIWLHYQRYRSVAVIVVVLLGAALLVTSHHFLSDILAGVLCGVVITLCLHQYMNSDHGTKLNPPPNCEELHDGTSEHP